MEADLLSQEGVATHVSMIIIVQALLLPQDVIESYLPAAVASDRLVRGRLTLQQEQLQQDHSYTSLYLLPSHKFCSS